MAKQRSDFTDVLVKEGRITADQREEATAAARSRGMKLGDSLIQLGYSSAEEIMEAMATHHRMDFVRLEEYEIPPQVLEMVPESVCRENTVLPVAGGGGTLRVAVSDPEDYNVIDKLRFIVNQEIELVLASRESILQAINKNYAGGETQSVDSMLQEFTDTAIEFTDLEGDAGGGQDESDAPIVRLVSLILTEAVQLRASDIHIEPFADRVRVRYRIDGVLVERDSPPRRLHAAILTRLKIMGKIDITEKRRPQDGRIKATVNGKDLDLRVSMLPTNHGQGVVMRLLERDNIKVSIRDLGFSDEDFRRFQKIIKRPNGIFLVTGPTGSGKTTTLYAILNELNRPDRKIITAEDPVEYYLPGINQCEVKADIGMTFQNIIRAMLRQAPNVILVGEIRDKETADIAIQASLTGHLVFSTLHTNDAPGSVTRLVDMGVQPFLVASSLTAAMAQRLVRRVCSKCKQPYTPKPEDLKAVGINPERATRGNWSRGRGCKECHQTGFKGRAPVFELMPMNQNLRELTFRREPLMVLRREARANGMRTLFEDGLIKAFKGVTTIEEVVETTGLDK